MSYKINVYHCIECEKVGLEINTTALLTELTNEEYLVHYVCPNGHITTMMTSVMRYGYLFDLSLSSYIENNFQESFLYLYSSLELFWRDFTAAYLVVCQKQSIELVSKLMNNSDKLKTSERRYGAFISSYCSFFNSIYGLDSEIMPETLFKKIDKLRTKRNSVVHNGELIDKKEIEEYIFVVYNYIKNIEKKFIIKGEQDFFDINVFTYFLFNVQDYLKDKTDFSSVSGGITTIVGSFSPDRFNFSDTLDELVDEFKSIRQWIEF